MAKKNIGKIVIGTAAATALAGAAVGVAVHSTISYFSKLAFGRRDVGNVPSMSGDPVLGQAIRNGYEWLHARQIRRVEVLSEDGLILVGHYLPAKEPKRLLIECHGWRGSWDRDFSVSSPILHERGYSLLLIEQRGQGESEGEYMSMGPKEKQDIKIWVRWAVDNTPENLPIYVCGISMGAGAVLMAADEEYPDRVKGLVADCGFPSAYDMIKTVGKNAYHVPEKPFVPLLNRWYAKHLGADLTDFDAREVLQHATLPVFFVHGTADTFVPAEMTIQSYEACTSEKQLLLVEGAGHGASFLVDTEGYLLAMEAFCEKCEKKEKMEDTSKD